jgi:predicted O-methyltransferase YrrM
MKRERRVELRENELAESLQDMWVFLRKHGAYIAGGAVVLAVIFAATSYVADQRRAAVAEKRAEINRISTEYQKDQQGDKALDALKKVAAEAKDPEVVKDALRMRGRLAESLALKNAGGPDVALLDQAREAYTQLLDRFGPESMLEAGSALTMLAKLEGDYFVLDGNPPHKETARRYWERLKDEARFKGTPYQSEALVKLNEIDAIFKPVTMVDAPPPPPPVTTAPATQPATTVPPAPTPPADDFTPLEPAPSAPPESSPTDVPPPTPTTQPSAEHP